MRALVDDGEACEAFRGLQCWKACDVADEIDYIRQVRPQRAGARVATRRLELQIEYGTMTGDEGRNGPMTHVRLKCDKIGEGEVRQKSGREVGRDHQDEEREIAAKGKPSTEVLSGKVEGRIQEADLEHFKLPSDFPIRTQM